jgi:tetratricopeptide (TPR) repeat protein
MKYSTFLLVLFISATASGQQSAFDYYNIGLQLKDEKNCTAAIAAFKKAIELKPGYTEALYEMGWCCNDTQKFAEALAALTKAKANWPDVPKLYFELGYAYQKLSRPDDAKTNYNKCLELKPDYTNAYKQLADMDYDNAVYDTALVNYTKYFANVKLPVTNEGLYYKKGYCENAAKRYDDAIASMRKAIEIKSNYYEAYSEIGFAYTKLKKAEDALTAYNEALKIKPDHYSSYIGIGDINKDIKKNTDEALKIYLKANELMAGVKKTLYCIGWCYNDKSDYGNAITYLNKAIALDGKYNAALTELGYSYYKQKNYTSALETFKKNIELNKSELSYYYAGCCYVDMGNKIDSQKMYEALKAMSSKNAEPLMAKISKM